MTHPAPTFDGAVLADLPEFTFDEVFHVGSLDSSRRRDWSYEGEGLSVSVHPDEWESIARLGGNPTWVVRRTDSRPLRFASWHDLTEPARTALRAWGASNGWVQTRTMFRVSWFDDEWDDTLSMDFNHEDTAREEAKFKVEDEDVDASVTQVTAWRPTILFPAPRIGADTDPSDALLSLWVGQHRPDMDGVWWDDLYDPSRLSCPRGVLVHDLSRYRLVQDR